MRFVDIQGRFHGVHGRLGGLPGWARGLLLLAALPGIALIALSVLVFLVSLLALLLLTVPLYRLLRAVCGSGGGQSPGGVEPFEALDSPGRKRVEATIVE